MNQFVSANHKKVLAFEYVLKNLLVWNKEVTGSEQSNDLSTLKAIKLLFFVTAVNTKEGGNNILLNTIFNDFVAMPYGHVESGIYEEIRKKQGVLNFYRINNSCTTRIQENALSDLESQVSYEIKNEIVKSIESLKKINYELISLSAFELVDLSHTWYSWKKTFSNAKKSGIGSMGILPEYIIHEDKNFSLQIF